MLRYIPTVSSEINDGTVYLEKIKAAHSTIIRIKNACEKPSFAIPATTKLAIKTNGETITKEQFSSERNRARIDEKTVRGRLNHNGRNALSK
jgi:hypothetical protein